MNIRYALALFFFYFIFSPAAHAQIPKNFTIAAKPQEVNLSAERLSIIDKMMEEHISKERIPGAVLLIIRNSKIAYHKSFGYRNIETKEPLQKDDIFRIASQTKAITSLAVMMLWEEGKFLLNDPISDYIPEFKNPRVLKTYNAKDTSYTTEPAKSEITIRQLLTHTSGIDYPAIGSRDFKAIYAKAGIPSGLGNDQSVLMEKMKLLATLPIKHQPGEKWTYGVSTDLLGYLVEVLSGVSLDEYLTSKIFKPLGMTDTHFYLPENKQSRLVKLHEDKEGKAVVITKQVYDHINPDYPVLKGSYYSGGAGLSSTALDYAKFLQLFINNGEFNGVRLVSRKTIEFMVKNHIPENLTLSFDFSLAFRVETEKKDHLTPATVGTLSWGGAYNTFYWADPQEKLIGILYTNMYLTPYWNLGEKFNVLMYQALSD
jgi:CubicO group peptidase (beta-lactamase class C family)